MSGFVWQYPAALIALIGVVVPLIIHLLDRGSARQLDFAPLHLLEDLPRASLRRLRLRERLLWLLRSLLVAIAAILLASPALRPAPLAAQAWLLVQPGLEEAVDASVASLSQRWGIDPGAIDVRWLEPGFAPSSIPAQARERGDFWGVLLAADTRLSPGARLAVIANPRAADLGPVRPRLSRPVEWLTSGEYSGSTPPGENGPSLAVYVDAAPSRSALIPVLTAAVDAWRRGLGAAVDIVDEPAHADWILYAPAGALPEAVEDAVAGGALLLTDSPAFAKSAATSSSEFGRRRIGSGLWLRQPQDWTALVAGSGDFAFPLRLWRDLGAARLASLPPGIAIPREQAAPVSGAAPRAAPPHSLTPILGVLLLWLLALERWLSGRIAAGRRS